MGRNSQCIQCQKAFSRNDYLTTQLKTHSEEKHNICNQCEKTFSWSSFLIRHSMRQITEIIYSEEIPYQWRSVRILLHKIVILNIIWVFIPGRLYQCRKCGKVFFFFTKQPSHISYEDPHWREAISMQSMFKILAETGLINWHLRTVTG